jgi:formate hydrogenlyase transcriptional activator
MAATDAVTNRLSVATGPPEVIPAPKMAGINRLHRHDGTSRLLSNQFPVDLPPLRERPEDIRLLVHHFAMAYAARMRKRMTTISETFMTALIRHSWPGNVRELQNFIERSVILSTNAVLSGALPEVTYTTHDGSKGPKLSASVTLKEAERSHILETLQQTRGVVGGPNGAAGRLGMPRTTLIAKMRHLGISSFQSSSAPARATGSAA